MTDQKDWRDEVTGDFLETLQLHANALTIKAIIATHPNPEQLGKAMQDLFAQFQTMPVFLSFPEIHRTAMRRTLDGMLPRLPGATPQEKD